MSFTITDAFVQQYNANVFHLSQQKGSRLRMTVRNKDVVGKSDFVDRIGKATAVKKTSRHGDTPFNQIDNSRRMLFLEDYETAELVDQMDKVKLLCDPASEYAIAQANALGRSIDDVIIAAATGNAFSGETGSATVALPAVQQMVPTTGTVPSIFDVNALRTIKKKFDDNDVDESEERFIVISSQQLQDLLGSTQITSSDFATVKALVRGEVNQFMGFTFIRSQRLAKGAAPTFDQTTGIVGSGANAMTNARSVIAYTKSSIALGIGMSPVGRITERADKSYSTQVYNMMSIGAARVEEEKVVVCYAKEIDSVVS